MPVGTIFSGAFCREDDVVRLLTESAGLNVVPDADLTAEASRLSGMPENKIQKAFSAKPSVFNQFTHEKERAMAWLRLAAAESLRGDNLLLTGYCGQLVSRRISHVLHVCLIADVKHRVAFAVREKRMTEKDVLNQIHREDADRAAWVKAAREKDYPWEPSLYDLVIPMDKRSPEEAAAVIQENMLKDLLRPSEASQRAVDDFILAARVGVELAREGHNVGVEVIDGRAELTINKHVMLLHRLESSLKEIAQGVTGIKDADVKIGKGFHQADIYRKYDFELPSRVLLVDDEKEFVESLSERLMMRDVGAAVAYDGESALNIISEDEPEVMILDLKMPGIDGIEVLKRVKASRPDIEVIILTGHGSDADRMTCMSLGAFAYIEKPFDIEELSRTLKQANDKVRARAAESRQQDR